MTPESPRSATAEALLTAGLSLFGERGFAATSTRALADAAGANVAAIAYHFGSKEKLREACGQEAARRLLRDVVGEALSGVDALLRAGPTQAQAEARLVALFDALVPALTARADLDPVVRFVLREQMEMSAAFAHVHDAFIAPMHERLCRLWAAATGADPQAAATRLVTLTFVAQAIYFRIARNVALKRLEWREIGPRQAGEIAVVIRQNLLASLAAARAERSRAPQEG